MTKEELLLENKKLHRKISALEKQVIKTSALRVNESWMRSLHDTLPQIVYETDLEGNLIYANDNAFYVTGYTLNDIEKGVNVFNFLAPKDRPRAMSNVMKVIRGEKLGGVEYSLVKKDGSLISVEIYSSAVIEESKPVGLRGIIIDITKKKLQEKRMNRVNNAHALLGQILKFIIDVKEEKALLRNVCNAISKNNNYSMAMVTFYDDKNDSLVPIYVAGKNQRSFSKLKINVKSAAIQYTSLVETFSKDREIIIPTLKDKKPTKTWNEFRTKFKFNSLASFPIHKNNEVIGVLSIYSEEADVLHENETAVIREISQNISLMLDVFEKEKLRYRAEKSLIESEATLYAMFDQAAHLSGTISLDGKVTKANKTACDLLGLGNDNRSIIGKAFWDTPWWTHSQEEQAKLKKAVKKAASGEFVQFETTHYGSDGNLHYIDFTLKPIRDDKGKVMMLLPEGRDITKMRTAEMEINNAHKKLLDIIDSLPDAVFVIDKNKKVIAWNRAIEELTGVKKINIMGKSNDEYFKAFYPENRPLVIDLLEKPDSFYEKNYFVFNRDSNSIDAETFIPHLNKGKGMYVWINAKILKDKSGKNYGAIESIRDITAFKKAQIALQESEELFRGIFDQVAAGVGQVDIQNGNFQKVNDKYCSILGYSRKELLSLNVKAITHPEDYKKQVEYMHKLQTGQIQEIDFEKRYIKKGGNIVWVNISLSYIKTGGQISSYVGVVFDITEKKLAEEALKDSEEKYRLLVNSAAQPIFMINTKGIFTFINHYFAMMLGGLPEAFVGKSIWDLFPIEEADKQMHEIKKAMRSGELVTSTRKSMVRDKVMWFLYRIQPQKDINGKNNRVLVILMDITERILAEEALKESEATLRSILNSAPVGIGFTKGGVIQGINPKICEMIGLSEEDVIGKSNWFLSPSQEDFDLAYQKIISQMEKKGTGTVETKWVNSAGKTLDIILSSTPIDINDLTQGFTFIALDITERKKIETELALSEERFRSAFLTSPDSINLNRLSDGMYLDINEGFTRITGYTREEIIGKTSLEINIWVNSEERYELINGLKESGIVNNLEAKFRMKNGSVLTGLMSASIISIKGEKYILSITRNINELKKAEEALRNSERHYRTLFDLSPAGIVIEDENGMIIDINEAISKNTGYKKDEIIGKSISLFAPPGSNPIIKEDISRILSGETLKHEVVNVGKDGLIKNVELHETMIILPNGKPGILSLANDITDRKQVEIELRRNEALLKESQRVAQLGSYTLDANTGIWESSNVVDEIFGINENYDKSVEGWMNIIADEDKETMGDYFLHEVFGEHNSFDKEYRIRKINSGELRWVHELGELEIRKGKVVSMIGTIQDITDRKLAQEKLHDREQFLETLFEHIPNMIFVKEVEELKYVDLNRKGEEILGFSRDEMIGKNDYDFFPKDEADFFTSKDREVIERKSMLNIPEEKVMTNAGEKILHTKKVPLVDKNGNSQYLLGISEDITDKIKAETALKQSEEQYKALSGRLINIREEERIKIARELHDHLGQGLTGLKMDISWVLNKLLKGDVEKLQAPLIDKAKSIVELIDDNIKAVRKISTELRPNVLDYLGLEAAIEWQANEFQQRSGIPCKVSSSLGNVVLEPVYSTNIFRIFQEILTNVLRHASATKVNAKLERKGNNIILQVKDNGTGIKQENIENKHSLGLLGMRERTSFLEGNISFESNLPKGTIVTLIVPVKGGK